MIGRCKCRCLSSKAPSIETGHQEAAILSREAAARSQSQHRGSPLRDGNGPPPRRSARIPTCSRRKLSNHHSVHRGGRLGIILLIHVSLFATIVYPQILQISADAVRTLPRKTQKIPRLSGEILTMKSMKLHEMLCESECAQHLCFVTSRGLDVRSMEISPQA